MTENNKSFINMMRTGMMFDTPTGISEELEKKLRTEQITMLVSVQNELTNLLEQCQRRWGDVPVTLSLDIDPAGYLNITAERIENDDA